MIVSNENRYVFVELPRTGTTAIGRELIENYGGERLPDLEKHATYSKFLATASPAQRDFFVFSCIRNPLDKTASLYAKYKSDHHAYLDPNKTWRENPLAAAMRRRQFRFVKETNADFEAFFRRFFRLPYDDWSCLDHGHFDMIVRFENLQADFSAALERLGLTQIRPLPKANTTRKENLSYLDYYTESVRSHAVWIFGPYMKKWGYEFPGDWQAGNVSTSSRTMHALANVGRKVYWRLLR